jgi:hypothetical protein
MDTELNIHYVHDVCQQIVGNLFTTNCTSYALRFEILPEGSF